MAELAFGRAIRLHRKSRKNAHDRRGIQTGKSLLVPLPIRLLTTDYQLDIAAFAANFARGVLHAGIAGTAFQVIPVATTGAADQHCHGKQTK